MRVIIRSITVVIPVLDNQGKLGGQVKFPDVPELREQGTLCYGFQTYSVAQSTRTITPNLPVISAADSTCVVFTLLEKSTQKFKQLPWALFSQPANFGNWFETEPFDCNVQGSFINFTSDTAATTAFAVPIVVHYSYPQDRR